MSRGRLSAVIDFADLSAGDPATDLAVAWMLFPESIRSDLQDGGRGRCRHLEARSGLGNRAGSCLDGQS